MNNAFREKNIDTKWFINISFLVIIIHLLFFLTVFIFFHNQVGWPYMSRYQYTIYEVFDHFDYPERFGLSNNYAISQIVSYLVPPMVVWEWISIAILAFGRQVSWKYVAVGMVLRIALAFCVIEVIYMSKVYFLLWMGMISGVLVGLLNAGLLLLAMKEWKKENKTI